MCAAPPELIPKEHCMINGHLYSSEVLSQVPLYLGLLLILALQAKFGVPLNTRVSVFLCSVEVEVLVALSQYNMSPFTC